MTDININGVTVTFPFKPYKVQEDYMSKVIECLQNGKHGVLESPTGTGKTLCLLCSSLSWLLVRKAQVQAQALVGGSERSDMNYFSNKLSKELETAGGSCNAPQPSESLNFGWSLPKIIYASRTHSQLSQAMQELKKTSYKHVKVAVLGSRDQLCIHPEVIKEQNTSNKIHMCQVKIKARTCHYYNNIEMRKNDPIFTQEILDIEDLVKAGQKARCCPYFLSRELKQNADITFMPYNYLLDPKTRRAQGIELQNNIILLDEAHNVEKTCEEAASMQICSTDIALCIDEITSVMKSMADEFSQNEIFDDSQIPVPKDFSADDLCILKAMFLELEKGIDQIKLKKVEGETFPGSFIFELLEKADLTHGKEQLAIEKLDKVIQYLSTTSTSPFSRKGNALQKFNDLLRVAFTGGSKTESHKERVKKCYKVYIQMEEHNKNYKKEGWDNRIVSCDEGKMISYWCFSPGFGMQQLLESGIRSLILTSGTLSPLKPFISELEIPIEVQLENPHIVTGKQVCVGILGQGPDGHILNSSFNTRNDPKYISSLGQTVYNFSILIPHGLLVFFPSYPIMKKCQLEWELSGLWAKIIERKQIFVEPQSKDAFVNTMHEYYEKIKDPSSKGAIFMAVCRGKVSEGLDFADYNGRAVLITGLPFPPMMDPRVILKKKYLEENKSKEKESLTGQQWYQLEASRAVNQAIGRIIRHKDDYGAIILCDCRFDSASFKSQLSAWIRPHIKKFVNFGMVVKELKEFFRYTQLSLPQPKFKCIVPKDSEISLPAVPAQFNSAYGSYSKPKVNSMPQKEEKIDLMHYVKNNKVIPKESKLNPKSIFSETKANPIINFNECKLKENTNTCNVVRNTLESSSKKRKFKMVSMNLDINDPGPSTSGCSTSNTHDNKDEGARKKSPVTNKREMGKAYLIKVKESLTREKYKLFGKMIRDYTDEENFEMLMTSLIDLFGTDDKLMRLLIGFRSFVKSQHVQMFDDQVKVMQNLD